MIDAADLLFSPMNGGNPLFKSQLDLVNHLLNTPESRYFPTHPLSDRDHGKALSRLKTYVSQLFSENVYRNVTEDFKYSLKLILRQKLLPPIANSSYNQIITALELKNNSLIKRDEATSALEDKISLREDIKVARHIVVISARPIDMTLPLSENDQSIRSWFYEDLVRTLLIPGEHIKYYRFNFPSHTYCDLFWTGLEKLIVKFLIGLSDNENYIQLHYHHNFSITPETMHEYEDYQKEKPGLADDVSFLRKMTITQKIARETLEQAERNKTVLVFQNNHPIFTIPIVAINPNEGSSKVYGILDTEDNRHSAYKFTQENTVLWRIFFWDKLKASDNGESISYRGTISRTSSDQLS